MAVGKIDFLAAPESPGADHKKADQANQNHPDDRDPVNGNGNAFEKMDDCGNHACRSRNRHAHEIFPAGPAWIFWHRVDADIKTRQSAGAAQQKKKADECAELDQLLPELYVAY